MSCYCWPMMTALGHCHPRHVKMGDRPAYTLERQIAFHNIISDKMSPAATVKRKTVPFQGTVRKNRPICTGTS